MFTAISAVLSTVDSLYAICSMQIPAIAPPTKFSDINKNSRVNEDIAAMSAGFDGM
jgi:hypothetical protein